MWNPAVRDAMTITDELGDGWDAIARGAWEDARARFSSALADEETPELLEGLAMASWWLDDGAVAFAARERAYGLFGERRDPRGAARVAIWLASDSIVFRRQRAVANGWLRRAHRLLGGAETNAGARAPSRPGRTDSDSLRQRSGDRTGACR